MTRVLMSFVLLCSVLWILSACSRDTPPESVSSDRQGRAVAAIELTPRDISRQVVVSAPVVPRVHIRLASRTNGTVQSVFKEEGDYVAQGELLAELDTDEQRAELARAEAEEERARLEYQRMTELRARDVISPADYQQSRANLQFAESQRALWRTRVAFGRITAPQAGVITRRYLEPGEAVQQQATLFEISAMDQLVMQPGLSELDVVHLMPGQEVPVRLDALPNLILPGSVRRIFPSANVDNRLVTVEIALPPDAAEQGVRPGFLARVDMELDRRSDVLALPADAVGSSGNENGGGDGDGHYVFVINDQRLQRRSVQTGITRRGWTEIINGLEPGEWVLANNPIDMRDGQRVRVVEQREAP